MSATTILYPAPAPVKLSRPFGTGILSSRPPHRSDVSEADRAWWAEQTLAAADAVDDFDQIPDGHWDDRADEALAADRIERGLIFA